MNFEIPEERERERERDLIGAINKRKIAFFSHSLRHNKSLKFIFEGKCLEKKTRGRPRMKILEHAQQIIRCQNYYEM